MHDGYSEISLDMLNSEEGQLNTVFACYGSTVQHAQFLEKALCDFLTAYNRFALTHVEIDELETKEGALGTLTMGKLFRRLKGCVEFDLEVIPNRINAAIKTRNFLAHRFFLERTTEFGTQAGRFALLNELVSIEQEMRQLTANVNGMRIALCRTLGDAQAPQGGGDTVFSVKVALPNG